MKSMLTQQNKVRVRMSTFFLASSSYEAVTKEYVYKSTWAGQCEASHPLASFPGTQKNGETKQTNWVCYILTSDIPLSLKPPVSMAAITVHNTSLCALRLGTRLHMHAPSAASVSKCKICFYI